MDHFRRFHDVDIFNLKAQNPTLSAINMYTLPTIPHFLAFQSKIMPLFVTLTLLLTFDFFFSICPIEQTGGD